MIYNRHLENRWSEFSYEADFKPLRSAVSYPDIKQVGEGVHIFDSKRILFPEFIKQI